MQLLTEYIDNYFGGNKSAFARYMSVGSQQITRWVNEKWVVGDDHNLYSQRREIEKFVIAHNAFKSEERYPLHYESDTAIKDRKSLVLDLVSGGVYVAKAYGSLEVTFKTQLIFDASPTLTNIEISDYIDKNITLFQAVLTGAKVVFDGNHYIGQFNRDAENWIKEIKESLMELRSL